MSTQDIDAQLARHPKYVRNDNNGSARRILEGLIVAAILGLCASVWLLRETVAVVQVSQEFMQRQVDKIERRQDSLEGKITRGGSDAPDQQ